MPKKTVETIRSGGNNYVIQVKGNQKSLQEDIRKVIVEEVALDTFEHQEKGHGRHSYWHVSIFDVSTRPKAQEWKDLKRYIYVYKHTIYTSKKKKKKETFYDRLFIANQAYECAEQCYKSIRNHWKIENKLHWVKDVIHNEDKNRINNSNGAVNCSVISTIAINIHRKNGNDSITDGQIKFGSKLKKLFNLFNTQ